MAEQTVQRGRYHDRNKEPSAQKSTWKRRHTRRSIQSHNEMGSKTNHESDEPSQGRKNNTNNLIVSKTLDC